MGSRKLKIAEGVLRTFRDVLTELFSQQTYPDRAKQVLKGCTTVSNVSFLVTAPLGGWGFTLGSASGDIRATLGGSPVVGGSVLGALGAEEANKRVKFDVSAKEIRDGTTYEDTLIRDDGSPLYVGDFRGSRPEGRGRLFWPSTNYEAFIGEFVGGFPRDGTFFDERGFFVAQARLGDSGRLELLPGLQPDDIARAKSSTQQHDNARIRMASLQDWLGDIEISDSSPSSPPRGDGSAEMMVMVDNSLYESPSYGIIYRLSKDNEDKDAEQLAEWGTCVSGVDEGDGWFRVGSLYLPVELGGVRVLTPLNPFPEDGVADDGVAGGGYPCDA